MAHRVSPQAGSRPADWRETHVRVRSKWNIKGRARSLSEIGGASAFILWRIAQQGTLNLENEGFQTDSNAQRLDVIAEFLAFLLHLVDRMKAEDLEQEARQEYITAVARSLASQMQDNRTDIQGAGEYGGGLIALFNERAADYAEFPMPDRVPGYAMKRYFGERVRAVMGAKDNQWITDQVMEVEVPEALKPLGRALRDLFATG